MSTIVERDWAYLILQLLLFIAALYGYVQNIRAIISIPIDHVTGLLIVRIAGIFVPPVGAVAGYF